MTIKKSSKCFMSVLAAVIITVIQPLSAFAAVWNGSAQEPYVNGDGAFIINTSEKLKWISDQVNSGNNDIDAVVTADLQLNAAGSTANEWVPIGTSDNPFLGSFDGGNHKISGLYINNADQNNQGLFGYIGTTVTTTIEYDVNGNPYDVFSYDPSEISYVVLDNVNITGSSYVGGIAGYSLGGFIKDCSVSGAVTGTANNVGGILGHNRKMASVENCLNIATVTGDLRVGGIVGYNFSDAEVQGCCNNGAINAASYVGGLVGTSSGSVVGHSYNKGSVTASVNQAGGLVGYVAYGDIIGNYSLGTVTCPGVLKGIAFGNVVYSTNIYKCYYDKDHASMTDSFATPAEYVLMQDDIFVSTLNVERDIFVTDYFVINNGYPILRWQLTSWTGELSQPAVDGEGIYLIGNGSELAWFAALVNGALSGVPADTDANARLTKDILLNPDWFDETSNVWTPIGSLAKPYIGEFDGTMHRIRGIYILNEALYYAGLFGYVGTGGSVSNLYTETSSIKAGRYVSVIVGYNDGTVTNCHNSTTVEASYYTGGIVGENHGTISNCSNKGYIKSNNYAGGIVGTNYGLTENCINNGYIYGISRSGGIAGATFSTMRDVYSKANISGGNYVGGIVGELGGGTLTAAYSYGSVKALGSLIGAAIGKLSNSTAGYCYYNSEIAGVADSNATGLSTAQMSASTSITAFSGFTGTSWVKRDADMYFNYCPELYDFYNSDDSQINEASKQSVKVLKPDYVVMDEVDGEMNTYYTTMSSAANHINTGEGSMVVIGNCLLPETVTIAGTVTITCDGLEHTVQKTMTTAENMFNITGVLNIDAAYNSTDSDPLLTFDGGRYSNLSGIAAFRIGATGTLNLYKGSEIINTKTIQDGGAIYNNGGILNMYGGVISNNITTAKGGGIYNNGGIVNITGGTISTNTADNNGGGIYFAGVFAEVNIENVTISGNISTVGYGGGIYNQNSTVFFKGGTISENSAYYYGGGLYNTGTFDFSGGTFSGNTVSNIKGSAIYENGTLNMSANAYVESNNTIYLATGKTVVNTGKLLRSGIAAHLYPQNFAVATKVLSGDYAAANYANFVADPQGGVTLYINSSGNLIDRQSTNVCTLNAFGGESISYTSVKEAIEAVGTESGIITLIADDIVEDTITVSGNIRIVGDTAANRSLVRYYTCEGDMFNVQSGASLEFGFVGTNNDSALIVDGSYTLSGLTGGTVVNNNGAFKLSDGATISNNYNSEGNGGAVFNDGEVNIAGGIITGCHAAMGGAVYSVSGNETEPGLQIKGGAITENSAAANGGAVAVVGGTYELSGGEISENEALNGGGIYIGEGSSGTVFDSSDGYENGTVTLYRIKYDINGDPVLDGEGNVVYESFEQLVVYDSLTRLSITDNTAEENGGGILVSGGSVDFTGGNISNNTALNGGGVAVVNSGDASFSGSSSVDLAISYHLVYDENNMATSIEYEYNESVTECSVSANTATESGGGIYIDSISSVSYTVCVVSVNTAASGSGVYVAGTFTMNTDSSVAEDNDVYLYGESVVTLGGAYTAGTDIVAAITLSHAHIAREILTGNGVADMNERFTITNDEGYFITDSGYLDADKIIPADDSQITIDRVNNILTGLENNNASSIFIELVNNDLTLYDANGNEVTFPNEGTITTNYTIVLKINGIVVDTVTISYIGDLTCDGDTDGEDANIVSYLVAGILTPQDLTPAQYRAADANNDGTVDVDDVLLLEQCGLLKTQISQTD